MCQCWRTVHPSRWCSTVAVPGSAGRRLRTGACPIRRAISRLVTVKCGFRATATNWLTKAPMVRFCWGRMCGCRCLTPSSPATSSSSAGSRLPQRSMMPRQQQQQPATPSRMCRNGAAGQQMAATRALRRRLAPPIGGHRHHRRRSLAVDPCHRLGHRHRLQHRLRLHRAAGASQRQHPPMLPQHGILRRLPLSRLLRNGRALPHRRHHQPQMISGASLPQAMLSTGRAAALARRRRRRSCQNRRAWLMPHPIARHQRRHLRLPQPRFRLSPRQRLRPLHTLPRNRLPDLLPS